MSTRTGYASAAPLLQHAKKGVYTGLAKVATGSSGLITTVFVRSAPHLKRTSSPLNTVLAAATTVTGVLRTRIVHFDQPSISMSFQVRASDTHSTRTQSVRLDVRAVLTTNGQAYEANNTASCGGPSSASGVCAVSLSVVSMFQHVVGTSGENATVYYAIQGKAEQAFPSSVVLAKPAAKIANATVDTVYAVLPSRSLFAGDMFEVVIRSRFREYLKTAGVQITVGVGLELVADTGKFPQSASGKDVFASTKNDGDQTKVYAVVAGRQDGKPALPQNEPTDEMLFTVQVRVQAGFTSGSRTVQITRLVELTDLGENPLTPSTVGMIESRDGVLSNTAANVYIEIDKLMGVFGYVDGPSEVLNTAVISTRAIKIPIRTVGVHVRTYSNPTGVACSTTFTSVIGLADCAVVLSGLETAGSRTASVVATVSQLSCNILLRVFWPETVALTSELQAVHPVAGWVDTRLAQCTALRYQRSYITATAKFVDGSGESIQQYGVSSLVRLQTSDAQISTITPSAAAHWFEGVSPGGKQVTVTAVGANNTVLATASIRVADQSRTSQLDVVGLDAVLLSSVGQLTVACTSPSNCTSGSRYVRGTTLGLSVGAHVTRALNFEGDSMDVVVSAVRDVLYHVVSAACQRDLQQVPLS